MGFKQYLLESEKSYEEDIKKTLNKIPRGHSNLIKGFKFEFQGGNTLKGDDGHVGLIDIKRKKIVIAAPWSYGREWTILHELGHMVWKKFVNINLRKKWIKIVKSTKMKKSDRQPPEELFSHSYSLCYAKNSISKFDFPEWKKFIENLPS